jgi:hypothetical protein
VLCATWLGPRVMHSPSSFEHLPLTQNPQQSSLVWHDLNVHVPAAHSELGPNCGAQSALVLQVDAMQ